MKPEAEHSKEILRWAREKYASAPESEKANWEYMFPELKESEDEDERIRKTLLRCCDDWEKGQFGCMNAADIPAIRAYLEKQKDKVVEFDHDRWSEKDKDMLNSVIATCQLAAQDRDSGPARHLLEMQERFLNSLPERFNLQSKQEWSEEDEKCIKDIINCLEYLKREDTERQYNGDRSVNPGRYTDMITKLLSLRPRPHWKPSEEQN